ncbi:Signal peptidase I [Scopulibacillus darangshiensis]|uniref:Signal peptidase I n=1 Tax=Scopulibacillus darangshiensis TaxID=442528 RepID=A0A4R2P5Z6_9BACL|nr:signal peptidase I [Scopulibacillus darangshiensis]TCP30242.1 Signal peptidase I [Scopulibacillus darangshiensis]
MTFHTFKKWVSRFVTTILFITLLFMGFVVISSKASGGEPNFFGYQLKSVLSGSMEPTFLTGSIIAVKPIENKTNLKKGKVITFLKDQHTVVTHRIHEVKGTGSHTQYITKGDNNEEADREPVLAKNVMAVYTGFTIPYVGYFMNYAQSKEGTAILLVLPGILLIIYSVITIWRAIKDLEDPKEKDTSTVSQ